MTFGLAEYITEVKVPPIRSLVDALNEGSKIMLPVKLQEFVSGITEI